MSLSQRICCSKIHLVRLAFRWAVGAALATSAIALQTPIYTAGDLDNVRTNLADNYVLMADIPLAGVSFSPIGTLASPFTGALDGNGFIISNFSFNGAGGGLSEVGLFGVVERAVLQGIVLEGIKVSGVNRVGGLVGFAKDSTIANCKVRTGASSANVWGAQAIGGLAGQVAKTLVDSCESYASTYCSDRWSGSLIGHIHLGSKVQDCRAYGLARGHTVVGGLSGNVHGSKVIRCEAYGAVTGDSVCGGLTGWLQEDLITGLPSIVQDCSASGDVTSTTSLFSLFFDPMGNLILAAPANGGLVGWADNDSAISGCTASGDVEAPDPGETACGGLVGFIEKNGRVVNCVATGNVIFGNTAAGLVGWAQDGTEITGCAAYGDVNAEWQSGGLVGAAERCSIDACQAYGNVHARGLDTLGAGHADPGKRSAAVGGLVGYTFPELYLSVPGATSIRCSSSHGNVSSEGQMTGGLIGLCWGAEVSECFSTGSVTATDRRLGALVGVLLAIPGGGAPLGVSQRSQIRDCYAIGAVTQLAASPQDEGAVGGLIGLIMASSSIMNSVDSCYSSGAVQANGASVGGLIGEAQTGSQVLGSYWDMNTSGLMTSAGGVGKTTAQMHQQATFAGWGFGSTWDIDEGVGYPFLLCPGL